jgi:hypothetical protein
VSEVSRYFLNKISRGLKCQRHIRHFQYVDDIFNSGEDSFSGELQHRFRVWCKGFSIRASSGQSASVRWFWQLVRRAHHPRAHLCHLDLCFSLVQAAIVSSSSVYCTCCIPPSFLHIYTLIFQTGFPQGGFIQGYVDQKYMCSFSCMLVFRTTLFQL